MPALPELQRNFARALLEGETTGLDEWMRAGGVPAERRLEVYRNNVRANFRTALAAGFPVLLRLVGETYFAQMAWAYQRTYPSPSGNLFHTGRHLCRFLADRLGGTEHGYFADVARLEWLCQESAVAADAGPLSLQRLALIDEDDYGRLRLQLHPAVRLMESRYPVMRIWQSNQPGHDGSDAIDLASGPDRLVIRCVGPHNELRRVPAGDFAFLSALWSGEPLDQATATATASDAGFLLGETLQLYVALNVISGFTLLQSC